MRSIHAYPYSQAGSWFTLSDHQWGGPLGDGLYLRTHLGRGRGTGNRDLYRIELVHDGVVVKHTVTRHDGLLELRSEAHGCVRVVTTEDAVWFEVSGCTLQLRAAPNQKMLTCRFPDQRWRLKATACGEEFVLDAGAGDLQLDRPWGITEGRNRGINLGLVNNTHFADSLENYSHFD